MTIPTRLKNNINNFLWGAFFLCSLSAILIFMWEIAIFRFFYLKEGTVVTAYTFGQYIFFSKTEKTKMSYWLSTFSPKMPAKYILIGIRKNFTRYYVKTSRCYHKLYDLYLQQTIEQTNLSTQRMAKILMQYENDLLPYPQISNPQNSFSDYLKIGGAILGCAIFLFSIVSFQHHITTSKKMVNNKRNNR